MKPAILTPVLASLAISILAAAADAPTPTGLALIPAGEFEMGDHHGFVDPKHGGDETPVHKVRLDAFRIGIYDITTKQYVEFLNEALARKAIEVKQGAVWLAGGKDLLCDTRQASPSSPIGWDGKVFSVLDQRDAHPMVGVRWAGAAVYCNWLSARNNLPTCYNLTTWDCDFNKSGFRLPTEAEWEYAARGGKRDPYFNYPWGDDADSSKANVPESTNPFRAGPRPSAPPAGYKTTDGPGGQAWRNGATPLTTPVGFFNGKLQRKSDFHWPGNDETYQTANGANGFGLYDMCGNVWQWCNDWYGRNYYSYSPTENPAGPAEGSPMPDGKPYRCMRGGSWFNGEFGHGRVSNRDPSYFRGPDPVTGLSDADGPWFHIGFRVVLPVEAEKRPATKPTPSRFVAQEEPRVPNNGMTISETPRPAGDARPGEGQRQGQGGSGQGQGGGGQRQGQGGGGQGQGGGGGGGGRGAQLLPRNIAEQLDLTEDQRTKIADLDKQVATQLAAILTPDQQQKLAEFRRQRQGQGPGGGQGGGQGLGAGGSPEQGGPGRPRDAEMPGNPPPRNNDRNPPTPQNPATAPANGSSQTSFLEKPLPNFVLRSQVVANGAELPKEFAGDGAGASPPLEWSGAPEGTKSFALIMHHTDAQGEKISYWVLYDLPADLKTLPKGVTGVGKLGLSSRGDHAGYTPPHSAGPGTRTYVFTLYALSMPPPLALPSGPVGHTELLAAMKDKVLGSADLSVNYTRYTLEGNQAAAGNNDPANANPPRPEANRPVETNNERGGSPPPRPGNENGGQRQGAGGERRPPGGGGGGGGGGRVAENNKTPTSPNPGQTVGLFLNTPKASPGYTLFAPKHNTTTYLMDNQGRAVHQWKSEYYPGQSVYLKPNGNLLHTCQTRNRSFTGGGEGGRIEEYDWSGKMVWEFWFTTDQYQQHHDIAPMPNGNILMLVVEKKSREECVAAGFPAEMIRDGELYPDSVVEVQPVYPNSGRVVWQWKVWDHMIQDFDKTKANYGDAAAHPELIYVRGGRGAPAFWNHANSISYNARLDQIIVSARGNDEIWFIDHSTTVQEAAGHQGGKHGKGGDLIYRWGNPAAYKRGSAADAQLNQQHDGEWVADGYPGAGHVTIFNNGYNRGYTSIEEIVPPLGANGQYVLEAGKPFGPEKPIWHYEAKNRTDFFSSEISGAQRLANGNTLICAGVIGHLFEVTPSGEMVWQYVDPVVRGGILAQGELPGKDVRGHLFNAIFKAHRYAPDYAGLAGRDLTPQGVIELPASEKGKTGMDKADAVPGERPPEAGGGGQGGKRNENRVPR